MPRLTRPIYGSSWWLPVALGLLLVVLALTVAAMALDSRWGSAGSGSPRTGADEASAGSVETACGDPGLALRDALVRHGLTAGASERGLRPASVAEAIIDQERELLRRHCRHVLPEFERQLADLWFADAVN